MSQETISLVYEPLPAQQAFRSSSAKIRGYGGAMGGGKSFAGCQECVDLAFQYAHVGLKVLIARQNHTSITETTKKTMMEQVLDSRLILRKKESGGEDYVDVNTGGRHPARFHFVGLDDPVRWFSAEIGLLFIDQAEECDEDTVVKLMTRLRQKGVPSGLTLLTYNPANPGHWLQKWFVTGATAQTKWGYRKEQLFATGATRPLGDAEFFFARATDNPYLDADYVENTLGGLPELLRRRYLDGEWIWTTGTGFFDAEALEHYRKATSAPKRVGFTDGDPTGKDRSAPAKVAVRGEGPLWVWAPPVRERFNEQTGRLEPAHEYIITVDTSSGGATDFSAVQVLDIHDFEQVAEYQAKLDPDQLAIEAARLGYIYNRATVAPEITGGWGFSVIKELERLKYPRIYTRRIEDRRNKKWTDKLGWDTTVRTRAYMLDTLERVLRERELGLHGERTFAELVTFVRDENGRPAAQPGTNDDLVITLAMAVTLAQQLPGVRRRLGPLRRHRPAVSSVTGY